MPEKIKKTKLGRKPYQPTDKDRTQIKIMATAGIQQSIIARVMGITGPTLRKYFKEELETSMHLANAQVAAALFESAVKTKNVTAQIFWLKTRAGWKETIAYEGKKEKEKAEAEKKSVKFAAIQPPVLKIAGTK